MKYLKILLVMFFTLSVFVFYGCGGSDKVSSILPDVRGGDDNDKTTINSNISTLINGIKSQSSSSIQSLFSSSYSYNGRTRSGIVSEMVSNAVSFVNNKTGQTESYTATYDSAAVTKVRELNPKSKIAGVYLSTDCPSGSSNTCYMIGVDYKITGGITNNATSTTKDIQIEGMRYILFEKTSEGIVITRTHNTSANYTVCTDDSTAGCSSSDVSFSKTTGISADSDSGGDSFSLSDTDFERSKEVAIKTGSSETISVTTNAARTPDAWTVTIGGATACDDSTSTKCTVTNKGSGVFEVSFTVPTATSLAIAAAEKIEMAIEIIQETFDVNGSVEAEVITEVPAETDGSGS